jgi:hypothetical protein
MEMEPSESHEFEMLLQRIKTGRCTPFLGAGACYGTLPLGSDLAHQWAIEYSFPMEEDSRNLTSVAQYLALRYDAMFPKEKIVEMFIEMSEEGKFPNFNDPDEPHRVLASLPLPVYITTNYDDFMLRALVRRGDRNPRRELCRWNSATKTAPSSFDSGYVPSVAEPVVFHLHGYSHIDDGYGKKIRAPESLVLTEDDYLDFINNLANSPEIIPPPIQKALTETSLLFVGYRLADTNFRALLRGLTRFMEKGLLRRHMAVMLPPRGTEAAQAKAQDYLTRYFKNMEITIYWGTAAEFAQKLRTAWSEHA